MLLHFHAVSTERCSQGPPSFLKTEHATQYFSGRRRGRQCLTLPPPSILRGETPCKRLPFLAFSRGRRKGRERTKISAVTHFSAPSSEKAATSKGFMDGDGKEGRLAACNNTVLAKLQVCRETLASFPPWLDSHPLVWKGTQGHWEDQDDGVGDSGHESGSGATSFHFLRCWRKGGG